MSVCVCVYVCMCVCVCGERARVSVCVCVREIPIVDAVARRAVQRALAPALRFVARNLCRNLCRNLLARNLCRVVSTALGCGVNRDTSKHDGPWQVLDGHALRLFLLLTLVTCPRRSLSLKLSYTRVYEP